MTAIEERGPRPGVRRIIPWAWILPGFVGVIGLQILIRYLWPRLPIELPGAVYLSFNFFFTFGPGVAGAIWSLLGFYRLESDKRPPGAIMALVVLLSVLLSWCGAFVALNFT